MLNNLHSYELNKKNITYILNKLENELYFLENSKDLDIKLNLINQHITSNKNLVLKTLPFSSLNINTLSQMQLYKIIYSQNGKSSPYLPIFELRNLGKSLQEVCNTIPKHSNINICLYSNNKSFPISIFKNKNITVKIYNDNKCLTFTLFENSINPLIFNKLSLPPSHLGLFTYENITPNANKTLLSVRKSSLYQPINFNSNFYFIKKYVIKKMDTIYSLNTVSNKPKITKLKLKQQSKNKKSYKGYEHKTQLIANNTYDLNNKSPYILYNCIFANIAFKELKIKYYTTTKIHYYLNSTFDNLFTISKKYRYTYNNFIKLYNIVAYKDDLNLSLINELKNINQNHYNKFYKVITTNFIEEISFKGTNQMKKLVYIVTLNNLYSDGKKYQQENIFNKHFNKKDYLLVAEVYGRFEQDINSLANKAVYLSKPISSIKESNKIYIIDKVYTYTYKKLDNENFLKKVNSIDNLQPRINIIDDTFDNVERNQLLNMSNDETNLLPKVKVEDNVNDVGVQTDKIDIKEIAGETDILDHKIKLDRFTMDNAYIYNQLKDNSKKPEKFQTIDPDSWPLSLEEYSEVKLGILENDAKLLFSPVQPLFLNEPKPLITPAPKLSPKVDKLDNEKKLLNIDNSKKSEKFQTIDPDSWPLSLEEYSEVKLGILENDAKLLFSPVQPLFLNEPKLLTTPVSKLPLKVDELDNEKKLLNIDNKRVKLFSMKRLEIYNKKRINSNDYLLIKEIIDKKISNLIELCNKNINEQIELLKTEMISDIKILYEYNLNKYNDSIFNYKIKIENNNKIIISYNKIFEDLYEKFKTNWNKSVNQCNRKEYNQKDYIEFLKQLDLIYPRITQCFLNFDFDNFDNLINDIKIVFKENAEPILSIFEETKIKVNNLLKLDETNSKIYTKITKINQSIEDLKIQYVNSLNEIHLINNYNYKEYVKEENKKIAINMDLHFVLNNKLTFDNNLIIKLKNISTNDMENNFKNEIIGLIDYLTEFNQMEIYPKKVKNKTSTIELDYTWKDYYNKVMDSNYEKNKLIYKDDIFYRKLLEVIKETNDEEIITNKLFGSTQEHILRKYLFENTQDFILDFYNKLLDEENEKIFYDFSLSFDNDYTNKLEILNKLKLDLIQYVTNVINNNNSESLKDFLFKLTNDFPKLDMYSAYDNFEKAYDKVKMLEKKINYTFEPSVDYILNYNPWQKKIITKQYNYFGRFNNKLTNINKKNKIVEDQNKIDTVKELPLSECKHVLNNLIKSSDKLEQPIKKRKSIDNPKGSNKPHVILKDLKPMQTPNKLLETPKKKKSRNNHDAYQNLSLHKEGKENVKLEFSYFHGFENQLFTPQKKPNQQKGYLGTDIKNIKPRTPLTRIG